MKKAASTFFLFLLLLFLFTACQSDREGSESRENEDTALEQEQATQPSESELQADMENGKAEEGTSIGALMVYEAVLTLETDDFDRYQTNMNKSMKQYDAYMVETSIQKTDSGGREGHITLRVPQPSFTPFLDDLEAAAGDVKARNISSRDVTRQYVDLEARLIAKEEIEARLLGFLEEAGATEDLVRISQDLERVQGDIESLKGEMNFLENQSEYSTITLMIKETNLSVPERTSLHTGDRIKQAFFSSLNGLASISSWAAVGLIGYSPFVVPLLVVGVWLILRYRRHSGKNE
ncbi:DUF4349 domain-containing protein [Halobacillus sp. Cin3]|uniref:DUF4349 domain-containing protein n=1 Tax=Halobacillus sp. Cin3 TaxID=2928441 RepID=UPI00248E0253|nr:DUF4349 domain-containing protein [Halobacillus sp. Cin3]